MGEQIRIGTGFGATYSASTIAAPLKKILLHEKQNKTFENLWHRVALTYRKMRVHGWHFCLQDIFQKWSPLQGAACIHLETSIALEEKNGSFFFNIG